LTAQQPIAHLILAQQLEVVLFQRCKTLLKQQDLIQGLTGFHWWRQIDA